MHIAEFDYDLPEELIAQHPIEPGTLPGFWFCISNRRHGATGIFMKWANTSNQGMCWDQ